MNTSLEFLCKTASKKTKYIIGLMSGTSLDGLDIALCKITGSGKDTVLTVAAFKTVRYSGEIKTKLRRLVSAESVSTQELTLLNTFLGDYCGQKVLETLQEWKVEPAEVDCIAGHGQTIYHAPKILHQQKGEPNATLQMGDGDHIARKTGILTVSDFRQKHTAAGGEGAPMAALVDELLFRHATESRILLNIGGMANFTRLPAENRRSTVMTTDTGPGNTLINKAAQAFFNQPFDTDGEIAKQGAVHSNLLERLMDHPFFKVGEPKSTGPEAFNMDWVRKCRKETRAESIADKDLIATLTRLSAETIASAVKKAGPQRGFEVYVSGGGMHNTCLMKQIESLIGQKVYSFEKLGFNPDAKEAACFAVLANETLSGEGFELNGERVNFGKISLPV